MKKAGKLIRVLAFLVGLVLIVLLIEPLFRVGDERISQTTQGFYQEKKNSLDAVYVGSSNVYAYWQAPLGFQEYGLAVYNYSLPQMPINAFKYMIEECRKTQPDALYIMNLNAFKTEIMDEATMHFSLDCMPFSSTKVKLVNELAGQLGYTGLDKLEFYFPLLRFHSGWSDLETIDFTNYYNGMKGASLYSTFLQTVTDVTALQSVTDRRAELTEKQLMLINDLMQYCQEENVKVLFVAVPQAIKNDRSVWELNALYDMVRENGFDAINLLDGKAAGIDFTTDFYNQSHCNIHGSLKYTSFLGQYLVDNYGFEDHRGDPAYDSWQKASELYRQEISPYTLDFERQYAPQDYSLPALDLSTSVVTGQNITLKWSQVENADGYAVYRRIRDAQKKWSEWTLAATLYGQTLDYTEYDLLPGTTYNYTVVPYRTEGETTVYGKINHTGTVLTTTLNAPKLVSLEEGENGMTLTWEPRSGAIDYIVYRAVKGESWEQLGTVDGTSYTDSDYHDHLPYVYTVRGRVLSNGQPINGLYSKTGLLRYADIEAPTVIAQRTTDGQLQLNWEPVTGASHYYVYKLTGPEQWERVARTSASAATAYTGAIDSQAYKVCAVIEQDQEIYEFPSEIVEVKGGEQ